jgi:hypothetical protein
MLLGVSMWHENVNLISHITFRHAKDSLGAK